MKKNIYTRIPETLMAVLRKSSFLLVFFLAVFVVPLALSGCGYENGNNGGAGNDGSGNGGSGPESWVRPNVGTLAPDGAEFTAIRRGVQTMMSRPASDPTSWLYQANMHGTYDSPALEAWNSCQHGSFFFLSWHRMYLYYFERILRAASGDPNLALPFWDYTDPAQRTLPEAFRLPADVSSNSLFVSERAPGINQGAMLPASATNFENAMAFTNFSSPTGSGLSFGGQQVPGPVHFSGIFGQLESQPHNIIHVLVGGNSGWMSDPNMAARDPIFYFHHANIDRLWNVWLSRGGDRVNPTEQNWLTQTFTFFDENGQAVQLTGQEVVDSAQQLNYTYAAGSGSQPQLEAITSASLPAKPFINAQQEVLVNKRVSLRLHGTNARAAVSIPTADVQAMDDKEHRLTLVLEDIKFGRPGIYYEVYAGLPQGEEPNPSSPYYVGNVAIFGQLEDGSQAHNGERKEGEKAIAGGATLAYDITDLVERLRARKDFDGNLPLFFVPRGLEMPAGQPGLQAMPEAREVQIETIKIVRE
jgi:tyrosinase